jgi:hypothetical protein
MFQADSSQLVRPAKYLVRSPSETFLDNLWIA